jgi:ADP-dependent NAD(P)H-hydrate dehydratase / NAD(P)H-hydrate epimerase
MDRQQLEQCVVTAAQMRQIEERLFTAGLPVAALMEKVVGRIVQRVMTLYPQRDYPRVGVLAGPGHNGGDALGVARELHFQGYRVITYCPFAQPKPLTAQHAQYCLSLGIPAIAQILDLKDCHLLIDGLFGFGLERAIAGELAVAIAQVNHLAIPIVSIDLPSGLHTDTGAILGTAIQATHTFCLGLWKQGLLQDSALAYVGQAELIDFDIPRADIGAVLGNLPLVQRITPAIARASLPLQRPPDTHKYKMGHLLLVCGSQRYMGAALLAGLAARATGVGLLSIAVPRSLKPLVVAQIPDALVLDCPETSTGAIAQLPADIQLEKYTAIACGPGLTTAAQAVVARILSSDRPLVLDADGLNCLADLGTIDRLTPRRALTILTPHLGEFQRLFPDITTACRIQATQAAAQQSGAIVLLKGARVAIAHPQGATWINPTSTPALARGGTGDVLTGLMGGLWAQAAPLAIAPLGMAATATWWHAQAGQLAAQDRTVIGVDASTLIQYLMPTLNRLVTSTPESEQQRAAEN